MNIEDKLFLNKFVVDNTHPHLNIKDRTICEKCKNKPCTVVCPVKNYKTVNGTVELSWEGCLECGSCRVVCRYGAIDWKYPQGGFGIVYGFGKEQC